MKKIVLTQLVFYFLIPLSIWGQRPVVFLHGLGESAATWQDFENSLSSSRNMTTTNIDYTSTLGFGNALGSIDRSAFNSNSLVICHSLGGLMARNINRNTTMGSIVAIGSPLDGAPIANSVVNGVAENTLVDAGERLLRGPQASLFSIAPPLGAIISISGYEFGPTLLRDAVGANLVTFGGGNTAPDVAVGSGIMDAERTEAPTNTPKISVFGSERSPTHWRIANSMLQQLPINISVNNPNNPFEAFMVTLNASAGLAVRQIGVPAIADATSAFYFTMFATNLSASIPLWFSPVGWYKAWCANEWYVGWDWIANDSERQWHNLIGAEGIVTQCFQESVTHCRFSENCDRSGRLEICNELVCSPIFVTRCVQVHSSDQSDGFIPARSQRGENSPSWRNGAGPVTTIEARDVNHKEEVNASNGEMNRIFDDIFDGVHGSEFLVNRR
jgi:hypothetical protein